MSIINLAAGQISIKLGAKGPNVAPVSACATGTHAIGDAFRMIQRGDADAVDLRWDRVNGLSPRYRRLLGHESPLDAE